MNVTICPTTGICLLHNYLPLIFPSVLADKYSLFLLPFEEREFMHNKTLIEECLKAYLKILAYALCSEF